MAAIDVYKIGVELVMGGNVASVIKALIPGLESLEKSLAASAASGKELAAELRGVGGSAAGIGRAADNMGRLAEAMAAMNQAVTGWQSRGGMPEFSVPGSARATASGGALIPAPYVPNFTIPPGVRAPLDATFNEPGEGRIPLYPNGRPGAKSGNQQHGGSPHDVLGLALGAGIAAEGLKHIFGPAIDLESTSDVLAADNRLTPADVAAAVGRAKETASLVPGSVAGENMKALLDLKTVFGSLDEAKSMLPQFAQMTRAFQLLDKKHGGGGEHSFAAAKAMEILGEMVTETVSPNGETIREMDPARGMQYLSRMQRAAIATDMRVAPKDYLALAKTARVAGLTLSDEFIYEKLPALIQTEGASRTGTALMSMAQVFDGGKLTNKSMDAMIGLGLASPQGLEHVGGHIDEHGERVGGRDVVHPEAIYDRDVLRRDPLEWVQAASKRMDAAGINGTTAQIDALMSASQRTTIAGILAVLLKDVPAIEKERENIRNTDPNATALSRDSTASSALRLHASVENTLTTLGGAALGDAGKSLDGLTSALNSIGKWAGEHPDGTRAALEGLAFGVLALGAEKVVVALTALGGSGKGGLFMLAGGILALSGAVDKFPEWLQNAAKGAVAGGTVAGVPGAIAGGVGAGLWNMNPLGLNDVTPGQALHGLGNLLHLNAYHPEGDATVTMQPIHIVFEADGRELSKVVTRHQLRMMGGHVSGTIRPDPSISPQYGAYLIET